MDFDCLLKTGTVHGLGVEKIESTNCYAFSSHQIKSKLNHRILTLSPYEGPTNTAKQSLYNFFDDFFVNALSL